MAIDLTSNDQWTLFGYDMRSLGRQWKSAWRDFLFSPGAPLRVRLDEPVRLLSPDGAAVFQGGKRREAPEAGDARCEALALPDSLYLSRTLELPAAAESELDAVLSMEIAANSPFDATDTVYGWAETRRDEDGISVALVVAARSALMHWLSTEHPDRRADATELWAPHGEAWICLHGFGESLREGLYRRRLLRVAGAGAAALVLLFAIVGLLTLQQRIVLEQLEAQQRDVASRATGATEQREALVGANEAIAAASALIDNYPNPHLEIARLTGLLGDDAFIAHFSMRGRDLRVRGRAQDAASVMQTLAGQKAFASVTAPQAISAVGNSGVEQFYLDLRLAGAESEAP